METTLFVRGSMRATVLSSEQLVTQTAAAVTAIPPHGSALGGR